MGVADLKSPNRFLVVAVLLFTASAVAMLWGLSGRWQDELRSQVMARAEQRALQLAEVLAGQMAAEFALVDHTLLDLRFEWERDPAAVEGWSSGAWGHLPAGMVSHVSLADAQGQLTFNSLEPDIEASAADRDHFQAARSGPDQMVIGAPVVSRLADKWMIPVGRPLYRDGRFSGEVVLVVSCEFLGESLRRLVLSDEDVVVLVHPAGRTMAHSLNPGGTLGKAVPPDRPFLQSSSVSSGIYREKGAVDGVVRMFGWQRVPETGMVLVVGLAESSVLAPMASPLTRSLWLTAALSVLLLIGGSAVAWLLWRVERSSQAVRESEQLLKDSQRMAKLGHVSQDLRAGTAVWSDEMYRIFGYDINDPDLEISGASAIYARTHPEDLPALRAKLEASVMACSSVELVHRIVMPSGAVKYLRVQSVVQGENGVPVRGSATVQDVTEVREAQLALERMNNELEERVASRTRELGALNNELEAFAYSVSHDLRTPLRSIHGFASLMEEDSENLSVEGRSHLRRIQDGARRMGLLITDLLTMAHHSRAVVNVQRVNLTELAKAVASEAERADKGRSAKWTIEPGLWAMGDPVLLRVVLQNLLGNAWKYTGQTPQPEISLTQVGQANGMVEFCVRDNGAGFDMAYVDQLFQPFKRLHAHHEFEGTGVGLASVQRLIQRHGGKVRAEGEVGKGAAIYFSLPADTEVPPGR